MKKEELETLKEIYEENLIEFKDCRRTFELQNKLRQEAIKRVKSCCPNDNVGGIPLRKNKSCIACERDIWFNNLTEEDLK